MNCPPPSARSAVATDRRPPSEQNVVPPGFASTAACKPCPGDTETPTTTRRRGATPTVRHHHRHRRTHTHIPRCVIGPRLQRVAAVGDRRRKPTPRVRIGRIGAHDTSRPRDLDLRHAHVVRRRRPHRHRPRNRRTRAPEHPATPTAPANPHPATRCSPPSPTPACSSPRSPPRHTPAPATCGRRRRPSPELQPHVYG